MRCESCGASLKENSNKCIYCGGLARPIVNNNNMNNQPPNLNNNRPTGFTPNTGGNFNNQNQQFGNPNWNPNNPNPNNFNNNNINRNRDFNQHFNRPVPPPINRKGPLRAIMSVIIVFVILTIVFPVMCATVFDSCYMDIAPARGVAHSVRLSTYTTEMYEGDTFEFFADVAGEDLDWVSVWWNTSNPSVATVDRFGRVNAVGAGTAEIMVTAIGDRSGWVIDAIVIEVKEVAAIFVTIVNVFGGTGTNANDYIVQVRINVTNSTDRNIRASVYVEFFDRANRVVSRVRNNPAKTDWMEPGEEYEMIRSFTTNMNWGFPTRVAVYNRTFDFRN